MVNYLALLRFLFLFLCSSSAFAGSEPKVINFDGWILSGFAQRGIAVQDIAMVAQPIPPYVNSDTIHYQHQPEKLVNPASVVKLFTTGIALDRLGSTFQFNTEFRADAKPVDGHLKGNLYVMGGGDPLFLTRDLWAALLQLRRQGVSVIEGAVVVDRSAFVEKYPLHSLTSSTAEIQEPFDEAPYRAYHAQPDSLLMNHGAMLIEVSLENNAVQLHLPEAPQTWSAVSQLEPVAGPCGSWKNNLSVDFTKQQDQVVVTVSGQYPVSCGNSSLSIRVLNQDWLFASWFREIWQQLGGVLVGSIEEGRLPDNTVSLLIHRSPAINRILRDVNKWSNNVVARHLEMAALTPDQSFDQSMRAWLASLGIDIRGWAFENGSGLSRNTRVTALGTSNFLVYMAGRPDFPDFLSSLPRAGHDGTLRTRLKGTDHYAYMKTGSLDDVRTVAGYLRTKKSQWYAFTIFVNGANADKAWPAMEEAIEYVYRTY